jgi:preprotein translocase subunit SecF
MRLADCKFSFVKHYKIFFSLTIIFLIVGIASMFVRGFNLGIDYTGGSLLDLQFAKPVTVTQVREVLKKHDLGNAIIQLESADAQVQEAKGVLIRTQIISDDNRKLVMADFTKDLGEYQINRVENVGATVGGELIQQAILAIVISWILMIIYITVRFQFKFALAAIIALIIDVLVTVSYFSLLHLEIDSTFVAALLTVVGYSINGTIVIFDRIRENLKLT